VVTSHALTSSLVRVLPVASGERFNAGDDAASPRGAAGFTSPERRRHAPPSATDDQSESPHRLAENLAFFLTEEVLAVERSGRIAAVLGGAEAVVGPRAIGMHVFDLCHPDDLPSIVRFALDGLAHEPGWEGVARIRVSDSHERWRQCEVHAVNQLDDPTLRGFVITLRPLDGRFRPEITPAAKTPHVEEPVNVDGLAPAPMIVPAAATPAPAPKSPAPETSALETPALETSALETPAPETPATATAVPGAGDDGQLQRLAGAVPLPIIFLDADGHAFFVNNSARDLCVGLLSALEDEGLVGVIDPRDRPSIDATLRSLAQTGGQRTITCRLAPLRVAAAERVVELTLSAQDEGAQSVIVTLVDVSAHFQRETELRRMASSDPLTGLVNRAEVEDALGERLRTAPERVALLYCDLDGFKAVNDTHGHDAGDELLVEIAQVLQSKTRPGDLVGRLGGDEFAVLVDSPDPTDAHGLACRIAVAIAELSSYRRLPVSASVGAATAKAGDTPRDLLRRADAAMYDEKRRRRVSALASQVSRSGLGPITSPESPRSHP